MRVFKTSPSLGVEAIMRLIPIHLHLKKLSRRSELRVHSLPSNHILQSLMGYKFNSSSPSHPLSLSTLTAHQCNLIRDYLVNMDNQFNEVFSSFDSLNPEFRPGDRIIDYFSNRFSFHLYNKKSDNPFNNQIQ